MSDLKVIEGGREEDLVMALLRALDLAESSHSATTVHLLKMALLNEGNQLATDLARNETVSATPKRAPAASRSKFVNAERVSGCQLPSLYSARRVATRPR